MPDKLPVAFGYQREFRVEGAALALQRDHQRLTDPVAEGARVQAANFRVVC